MKYLSENSPSCIYHYIIKILNDQQTTYCYNYNSHALIDDMSKTPSVIAKLHFKKVNVYVVNLFI